MVTDALNKLAGLSLGHHRLLLVTAVQGEVYVLLWIITHATCLVPCELDQVKADLHDNALHLVNKYFLESKLTGSNAEGLDQLDNKFGVDLIIEQVL